MVKRQKGGSSTGKPKKAYLARATSSVMLGVGVIVLLISIVYTSTVLAFIGLALTFWGAILLYIPSQEFTQKSVFDASVAPSIATLGQMIQELDYKGNVVYLPPAYFDDPEAVKIYIPKQKDAAPPAPEEIQRYEKQLFIKNPQGLLLAPLGEELMKLFERTLETSFTKVDLDYLEKNMPKLFIEDLEIAENLELHTEKDAINIRITNSICKEVCKQVSHLPYTCGKIGCPVCSAIACALTKASGKPIIIENIQPSEDGKIIDATYRILTITGPQEQSREPTAESAETIRVHHRRLSNLASVFLATSGSIILAWIGWITWYDMTVKGKDIALIFFGSRSGEAISLGIGMKVIYYFVLGSVLFVSGLVTFGAKKAREKRRLSKTK